MTLYQSLEKNDIFALVLQSLYVSGECYCIFLSVYQANRQDLVIIYILVVLLNLPFAIYKL